MPFPRIRRSEFTFRTKKQWGQVYWFDFGEPVSGQRTFAEPHPALIISDPTVTLPGTVLIIPITGAEHKLQGYEFHVDVSKDDCYPELDKASVAKVDQIYCVEERLLPDQYSIGTLNRGAMKRIYSKILKTLNFKEVLG